MKPEGYKWNGDSRDERESEFSETAFSTTRGGAYHSTWAHDRVRRQRKLKLKRRVSGMVWAALIAIGSSALVLYGIVGRLRS